MPIALITGASRGLGKQIALRLAGDGYSVALNYLTSGDIAGLVGSLGRSVSFRADVSDIDAVRSMAEGIKKQFGRLDLIVNNAGISKDSLLLKQSEDEWDASIGTNLTGCFNVIRALSPLMISSGGGNIINISSYSGLKGNPGQAAYSASKAAVLGLTYTAALELSEYNIRVNAILPGYMLTDMGMKSQKAAETAKNASILNEWSKAENVADFIAFIVKTDNITGQIFSMDSRIL